jgi:hypothetical protein
MPRSGRVLDRPRPDDRDQARDRSRCMSAAIRVTRSRVPCSVPAPGGRLVPPSWPRQRRPKAHGAPLSRARHTGVPTIPPGRKCSRPSRCRRLTGVSFRYTGDCGVWGEGRSRRRGGHSAFWHRT